MRLMFYTVILISLGVLVMIFFVYRLGMQKNTGNISWYELIKDRGGQTNAIHRRKHFVRGQCKRYINTTYWRSSIPTGELYTYGGITYCKTPKAGCTHWLRVLRFLAKDFKNKGKEVQKPSDIDRLQVHSGGYKNIIRSQMNHQLGYLMLSNTHSFMFTRNPFTRLWSAYIDKFILPDFWREEAVNVAKKVRQIYTDCVSDISFKEFVNYIVKSPPNLLDKHWKPVHLLCSPCHVEFDVIGKQETFTSDSTFIMDTFGIHLEEENGNMNNRNKGEVEMLTRYSFSFVNKKSQDCFDPLKISRRLWQAFQLNGYIHINLTFPLELFNKTKLHKNPNEEFLRVFFATMDSQNSDIRNQLKYQKRKMMKQAFNILPRKLIQQLIGIYKYDFELFQYDDDI